MPGSSSDDGTSSVPLVDGLDFSWLESVPLVNNEALRGKCMAVLDNLREREKSWASAVYLGYNLRERCSSLGSKDVRRSE